MSRFVDVEKQSNGVVALFDEWLKVYQRKFPNKKVLPHFRSVIVALNYVVGEKEYEEVQKEPKFDETEFFLVCRECDFFFAHMERIEEGLAKSVDVRTKMALKYLL